MGTGGADLVVIGGGCIGGWTAYHAARADAGTVVVVERGPLGGGASSRAAGIVRGQGGSATSVALGMWSIAFYERQHDEIGTDSGFRRLGYLLVATSEEAAAVGRQRVAEQRALGLDVTWLDADATLRRHPGLAPGVVVGASFAPATVRSTRSATCGPTRWRWRASASTSGNGPRAWRSARRARPTHRGSRGSARRTA
jgi:sarcosine oxidase subunit beta